MLNKRPGFLFGKGARHDDEQGRSTGGLYSGGFHSLQSGCARSRDEVIGRLVDILHHSLGGLDRDAAVRSVIERERLAPTVLAEGLALPHARLDTLSRPVLAMAASHGGIDFETAEGVPVHVVMLILTPKADPWAYLRLMATLSRTLNDSRVIKRLSVCVARPARPFRSCWLRWLPAWRSP